MKCLSARLLTTVFALLAAASHARADYLNWTYTTDTNPSAVTSNTGNASAGGAGVVALTPFGTPTPLAGALSIPVLAYTTSAGAPATFTSTTSAFALTLDITDKSTGDTGVLTFNGSLAGRLTPTSSALLASFSSPSPLTLDGHVYTVTIPTVTLASPTSPQQSIYATVSVSNGTSTGTGSATPEPASLILGGLGFSCLGMGCWWKRRRGSEAAAA